MTSTDVVDDALVGRCYTRARTLPPMIGQLSFPGGEKRQLAGGPYSVHQFVAFFVTVGLVWITRGLWGALGPLAVMVALLMPFVASFLVRHARVDGRSPFAVIAGWLTYWTSPSAGRLRGRTFRPKGEVLTRLRVHGGTRAAAAMPAESRLNAASPPIPASHPAPAHSGAGPVAARRTAAGVGPSAGPPAAGGAPPVASRRRPASHLQLLLSAQRSEVPDQVRDVG